MLTIQGKSPEQVAAVRAAATAMNPYFQYVFSFWRVPKKDFRQLSMRDFSYYPFDYYRAMISSSAPKNLLDQQRDLLEVRNSLASFAERQMSSPFDDVEGFLRTARPVLRNAAMTVRSGGARDGSATYGNPETSEDFDLIGRYRVLYNESDVLVRARGENRALVSLAIDFAIASLSPWLEEMSEYSEWTRDRLLSAKGAIEEYPSLLFFYDDGFGFRGARTPFGDKQSDLFAFYIDYMDADSGVYLAHARDAYPRALSYTAGFFDRNVRLVYGLPDLEIEKILREKWEQQLARLP